MKKLIFLFLSVLILTLSGCSGKEVFSNELYSVREKNGEHYIVFHNEAYNRTTGTLQPSASTVAANFISFSSVGEMRTGIRSGNFTEEEREKILTFTKNDNGAVYVCNTNKLYEALLPDDASMLGVDWYGGSYSMYFAGPGEVDGHLSINTFNPESTMDRYIQLHSFEDEYVISRETDTLRNGEVIVYKHPLSDITAKAITYSVTKGTTSLTIQELYFLHESETIPRSISIWGSTDGTYFTGYMGGFTERPSYEWVTSFGLKPYVETETE